MNAQPDIKVLCSVFGEKNGTRLANAGCGVFLSPRRILTSAHVITGTDIEKCANFMGQETSMKPKSEGGRHFINKRLDLALIEIRDPISAGHYASINKDGASKILGSPFDSYEGWMGTMYGNKPSVHKVRFARQLTANEKEETFGNDKTDLYRVFFSSVDTQSGYSGSPLFSSDGSTVLSIHRGSLPELREKQKVMFSAFGLNPSKSFHSSICPPLENVSTWIKNIEQRLGFEL